MSQLANGVGTVLVSTAPTAGQLMRRVWAKSCPATTSPTDSAARLLTGGEDEPQVQPFPVFRLVMQGASWRRSNAAFQGDMRFQAAQSVLLVAVAGALFGILLSLSAVMYLPDVGGSAEVQTLSAAEPGLRTSA
jgi:hypothetical protein